MPLAKMNLRLFGKNNNIPAADLAPVVGMNHKPVQSVYALIQSKRAAARYLHAAPWLVEDAQEGK